MSEIYNELKKYASAKRQKSNEWFFKTGVAVIFLSSIIK